MAHSYLKHKVRKIKKGMINKKDGKKTPKMSAPAD